MDIVNLSNLDAYLFEIADRLGWGVDYHAQIYKDVGKQKVVDDALDILEARVVPWFIRNGWMHSNWRAMMKTSLVELNSLGHVLPDLEDKKKLQEALDNVEPLGQIKQVSSGASNFVGPSKLLNFLYPQLFPKIDVFWVKDVCLRKVNEQTGDNRFSISGPVDIDQFQQWLEFGAEQKYDQKVLAKLEKFIGIKNAYAIAFEYCLLVYCKDEI